YARRIRRAGSKEPPLPPAPPPAPPDEGPGAPSGAWPPAFGACPSVDPPVPPPVPDPDAEPVPLAGGCPLSQGLSASLPCSTTCVGQATYDAPPQPAPGSPSGGVVEQPSGPHVAPSKGALITRERTRRERVAARRTKIGRAHV